MIAVLVKDLFFRTKIEETARKLQIEVGFFEDPFSVQGAGLVIIDLGAFGTDCIAFLKKENRGKVIGYLFHSKRALKIKAEHAGCDIVFSRSEFSKSIFEIFSDLAANHLDKEYEQKNSI